MIMAGNSGAIPWNETDVRNGRQIGVSVAHCALDRRARNDLQAKVSNGRQRRNSPFGKMQTSCVVAAISASLTGSVKNDQAKKQSLVVLRTLQSAHHPCFTKSVQDICAFNM